MIRLLPLVCVGALACGDGSPRGDGPGTDDTEDTDPGGGSTCGSSMCPGECADDGWCMADVHPYADYRAVWASAPDDLWAAEVDGMVRRGSGTSWTELPIPGATQLTALWGESPDAVWAAAGPGHVARWDGSAWVREPMIDDGDPTFQVFLHDPGTGQVFGVDQLFLWERTPSGWIRRPDLPNSTRPARGLTRCGGEQWFAMGEVAAARDGQLLGYGIPTSATILEATTLPSGLHLAGGTRLLVNDGQWGVAPFYDPVGSNVHAMATAFSASSLDNVFVATTLDEVHHWDGAAWTRVFERSGTPGVAQVYTDEPGQALVTIDNGATFRAKDDGSEPFVIVGMPISSSTFQRNVVFYRSSEELYTTSGGNLLRWQPGDDDWDAVGSASSDVTGLWVNGPTDAWFVFGDATIEHWDGADRSNPVPPFDLAGATFDDVWASGADVWFAGPSHVIRWDGVRWTDHSAATAVKGTWGEVAITGSGPDDVWVIRGPNLFHHWDGRAWTAAAPGPDVVNLACDGDTVVGLSTQPLGVVRGDPGALVASSDLVAAYSVAVSWMGAPDDAWVLGYPEYGGVERIRRWDGASWEVSWADPQLVIDDLYGLPGGYAFAVGDANVLVRAP